MVQNGTTSIVCDWMTTQKISRSQSMPSAATPGQRVTERAKNSLCRNGDKGHGGTAISLRGKGSVPDAILRGVAGSRCSAMTNRRCADERCQ